MTVHKRLEIVRHRVHEFFKRSAGENADCCERVLMHHQRHCGWEFQLQGWTARWIVEAALIILCRDGREVARWKESAEDERRAA